MIIQMFDLVGDFGEDKDAASEIRKGKIAPCIEKRMEVSINFYGVTLVTQSFIHALISDILRVHGEEALKFLDFANCGEVVRGIISTVVQYSLDSSDNEDDP